MASQPDLTNIAISSGYTTILHTEESGGISGSYTNVYDGDGTLAPIALATTGVKIIDGSYDFDVASHDGTNGLKLGGTLVTASATELNYLDVSSIGTAQASKALILDSSSDISGIRNLTATGTIQASAFTATGNTTIGDSVANDTVAFNSTITTNLVFEGSTANAYETTLSITDPTADRTWTIPDATDTSVGRATTDTLTNKTLTAPDINTPDIDGGTVDAITSLTVASNVDIGSYDLRAGTLTADGLTSGRVVFAGTNGVLSDDSDLSFSGATLSATNMTSSGTVTFGSLSDGSITITAFVDEDGMDSNSATLIPTQQSVKAYVDAQVTAQDLDFQGDSGGALNIDLDSETLDIAGGTGIDTSGSSNTLTVAIDSTVATLAGSQTLSNKTLASPTITTQFTIGSATISEAELEILDGASVTTTELNIMDGDTNATSTTVADADRVVMNDAGTMKQVAVTDLSAYFDDEITAMPNLVQTSALDSGSITSGFGNIDNGSSTANFGATTVDSLSVSDGNITNVGSIALDSISADGSSITFSSAIDFDSQNMTNVDIDSGTIDGATIATSNVTVGSGKTLDVSAGTLTLANNQISGDKVEGGTIASTTISALTTAGITASANIDIGSYDLRASTLTADSQTSGNVAIYGTNGLLSEDSDLTFSGSTLTATNVTISGTLTTTGTVQEVSTTNLNVQDPLILLNKYDSQPSNNAYDAGLVIKRGSSDSAPANVAMIWDESANTFGFIDTDDDGTTAGNVTVTDYENLRVGALTADDASTFTSTISTASGSTIGNLTLANGSITDSSGAISFGNENLSTTGTLGAGAITGTSFIIGSADIGEAELEILDGATVTTDELNLIDGGTARGTTAVASGDGILINDGGTMRMTNVDTVSTYFSSHNVGGGNIVTTGALNSGSITSGFGTIDTGSSNITTTGVGAFGSLDISGDVDVDGTLEADAITVNSVALATYIRDTVGTNMVSSNTESGITVTYDTSNDNIDFAVDASQTGLTSILNASLVAGRDADNQVKFSTDDQIIFRVAGGDGVTMKASGEIEATSLDISGAIDVDGTANLDAVDIDGALTQDGGNVVFNEDSGDYDFRVESNGNANMLFVDGGNDRVGIGEASPTDPLHVKTTAVETRISLESSTGKWAIGAEDNDKFGILNYGTSTPFIIDSSGRVGLGDSSPAVGLDVHWDNEISAGFGKATTDTNYISIRTLEEAGKLAGVAFMVGDTTQTGVSSTFQLAGVAGKVINANSGSALQGELGFYTNHGNNISQKMVLDKDGQLGIGTTSPTGKLSLAGASGVGANVYLDNHTADADACNIIFRKSRNATVGSHTSVNSADSLGVIYFQGSDGNSYETGASIGAEVDSTPGDGDMPGRLVFKTTADGASSATERMRIETDGTIQIPGTCSIQGITETKNIRARDNDAYDIGTESKRFDDIYATNGTINSSDARLKESIEDSKLGLDFLNKHRPVSYKQKGKTRRHYGLIAQEVEKVLVDNSISTEDFAPLIKSNLKDDNDVETGENIYGMRYTEYVGILIKAVQELSAKVEALENA